MSYTSHTVRVTTATAVSRRAPTVSEDERTRLPLAAPHFGNILLPNAARPDAEILALRISGERA